MFDSFFLAGFECATGYNRHHEWIDQIAVTQHDLFADHDYRLLREVGIRAVREAIRWPLIARGGAHDFTSIDPFLNASAANGIEVIWDLFHFGYPPDLDIFSEEFADRFAEYCFAAARYVRERSAGPGYFTPVNEPSFLAWAAGDAGLFAPHQQGRGEELKVALVRAAIRGIDAIRLAWSGARIVNADPICRVVTPRDRPDLAERVDHFNVNLVFESFDMISGRLRPELGGSREHLDVVGINYYWTNQWELTREGQPLPDDDPRRAPLRELVREVWQRYGGEILITETSHVDEKRAEWLHELTEEVEAALEMGVPLKGVCLYPILGMTEWHATRDWVRMGLWDLVPQSPTLGRIPYEPMRRALLAAQERLEGRQNPRRGRADREQCRMIFR